MTSSRARGLAMLMCLRTRLGTPVDEPRLAGKAGGTVPTGPSSRSISRWPNWAASVVCVAGMADHDASVSMRRPDAASTSATSERSGRGAGAPRGPIGCWARGPGSSETR